MKKTQSRYGLQTKASFLPTLTTLREKNHSLNSSGTIKRKVGGYSFVLSQKIGSGYSSQVYRGRQDSSGRTVALKIIDLKKMTGQTHLRLLRNEILILKQINNWKNILQVLDVITRDDSVHIISQFCERGNLSDLIKERPRENGRCFDEPSAIGIIKQIINGYVQLYRHSIIHRDLKPANILVSADGTFKICDFGFAVKKSMLSEQNQTNVGSPVYMAYQSLSRSEYSWKSDVWAIGVIFVQLLTGLPPWSARNQSELKSCIKLSIQGDIAPLWASQKSKQFIKRTIRLNPDERLTVEEMEKYFNYDQNQQDQEKSQLIKNQKDFEKNLKHPIQNQDYNLFTMQSKTLNILGKSEEKSKSNKNKLKTFTALSHKKLITLPRGQILKFESYHKIIQQSKTQNQEVQTIKKAIFSLRKKI